MVTVFFVVLSVLMGLVIYFDATRFVIPNWLVGLVLAFWPLMLLVTPYPVNWPAALLTMLALFAVGFVFFALRWMGGGDIKLLTACGLWCGFPAALTFLIYMALLGGGLAVLVLAVRKTLPWVLPARHKEGRLPRLFRDDGPVPYGLAIAVAFLILLWQQQVPGLRM